MAAKVLDRSRSYAEIFGDHPAKFEQDNHLFNADGVCISKEGEQTLANMEEAAPKRGRPPGAKNLQGA